MTEPDYWAGLPDDRQAALRELSLQYRGFVPGLGTDGSIPNYQVAVELLEWQRVEVEVMKAYGDWLARLKSKVEARGREWTREEFLRLVQLREHE